MLHQNLSHAHVTDRTPTEHRPEYQQLTVHAPKIGGESNCCSHNSRTSWCHPQFSGNSQHHSYPNFNINQSITTASSVSYQSLSFLHHRNIPSSSSVSYHHNSSFAEPQGEVVGEYIIGGGGCRGKLMNGRKWC